MGIYQPTYKDAAGNVHESPTVWIDVPCKAAPGGRIRRPVASIKVSGKKLALKTAADAYAALRAQVSAPDFDPATLDASAAKTKAHGVTFARAVALYLESRIAAGHADDSYRWIRPAKDHANPRKRRPAGAWHVAFADRPLRSLTSEEIEDKLGAWSKERKLGPATRNRALAQLSGFFSWAYGRKFLDAHPTQRGRVPKLAEADGRTRWLRLHELAALCDAAPVVATAKREDGTWTHADERTRAWLAGSLPSIIRFGAMTGMRLGEVSSLSRASYQDDGDGRAFLVTEKTKNGSRLAWPLEGAALDIVKAQLEAIPAFPASFLFPGPGGACACTAIRRYFPEIVRAAGLAHGRFVERYDAERGRWVAALDAKGRRTPNPNGVTYHVLRHSMASLALNSGTPAPVVQRMGNWKTATMVNRYAHLSDATMREAAGKLASLIGSRQRTVTVTESAMNTTTQESVVNGSL